jgi:RimJ/RimL family protein N-acetyltransferase
MSERDHPRLQEIHAFWAQELGCEPGDLTHPGTRLVPFEEWRGGGRVSILRREGASIVRLAPGLLDLLLQALQWHEETTSGSPQSRGITTRDLQAWLGEGRISPRPTDHLYYLAPAAFRPFVAGEARQLGPADAALLAELNAACTPHDRQQGEVEIDHPVVFGCFSDGQMAAAASFIYYGDAVADVGVITHPQRRGHGFGKAAVTGLSQWGLAQGRLLQYRAAVTNPGSMRIAESLGYGLYAVEEFLRIE